ncbi:MAG: glycosyltransferase family 4 protein [Candidatus Zixiibacteriota bacterium]
MRILAINWQDRKHPLAGGAEVHLHEILSRLGALGHDITLLCSRFPGGPSTDEYDHLQVVRRGGRDTFNWGVRRWSRALLRAQRYDVVIDDINKIPFYTPRYSPVPVLGIIHHLFGSAIFRQINPLAAGYVYVMESLVPRVYRGTPLMVVSESTRDDLVRRGMDAARIAVIHNGIDLGRYGPDAAVTKSDTPLIAYLGRLKKYKSIEHLFMALGRLVGEFPRVAVKIVGAGDDEPRLRRRAALSGVADRVEFTGFADFERKIEILRRAWVVVCPSLKEGWGLTNIEANACGTPVVCADVPGLRDSAREGETGLLYPYGDIAALADRLGRLLRDQTLRTRLGQGGLAWARSFSWEEAARRTEVILERVTNGDTRIGISTASMTKGEQAPRSTPRPRASARRGTDAS